MAEEFQRMNIESGKLKKLDNLQHPFVLGEANESNLGFILMVNGVEAKISLNCISAKLLINKRDGTIREQFYQEKDKLLDILSSEEVFLYPARYNGQDVMALSAKHPGENYKPQGTLPYEIN